MRVREASIRFNKSENEIRKLARENLIPGTYKVGNTYFIPDETELVLSEKDIKYILIQQIKFKDNYELPISNNDFGNVEKTLAIMRLLSNLGFEEINDTDISSPQRIIINSRITDNGYKFLFKKENSIFQNINIVLNSNSLNVSCVSLI